MSCKNERNQPKLLLALRNKSVCMKESEKASLKELKLKYNLKDSDQMHDKEKSINNVEGLRIHMLFRQQASKNVMAGHQ